MKRDFLYLIILCFISEYPGFSQKLRVIQLDEAYEKQEKITTKDFVQSFTYVTLETSPQCLIGANPKIELTDENIIITDQSKCLIFDRNSGSFVRQIGHIGRDPGGFQSTRGFFNYDTKMFYFLGWNSNLIKYSIEGKYLGSIMVPRMSSGLSNAFMPEKFTYVNEKLFVCNILNTNGLQDVLLLLFDENGKEMRTIPNRAITKEHRITISTGELNFFHNDQGLFYNQKYNDTIFHLNNFKTYPYLVYDRGKYRVTKETKMSNTEQIIINRFFESEKFIFFTFSVLYKKQYFAIYNKANSILKVCEIDYGVFNDTNEFVKFLPVTISKNVLVGLIQPLDIIKWIEDQKNNQPRFPSEIKNSKSIDPTGNPVIVFAKLQE